VSDRTIEAGAHELKLRTETETKNLTADEIIKLLAR
jgi:hypothetical protein